ncbi:MAG: TIGR01906 family membrane protein [Tissierellia bacterium]|nr:TIGR01906 family membrane protein [Tissierellia bacterium]
MKKLLCLLTAFLIVLSLFLTSLEVNSYDRNYFEKFQIKYGIDKATGLSFDELRRVNEDLISYLKKGNRNLLQPHFGDREIMHMEDVYSLYRAGRVIRNSSLPIIIIIIIILVKRYGAFDILKEMNFSMIIMWVFGILSSIILMTDFSENFIKFHHIFFDNDLWLLDPAKDLMIQMLPENFFKLIVIKTLVVFIISLIIVHLIIVYLYKKIKRNGEQI